MKDSKKTKKQLIDELVDMRQRLAELQEDKLEDDDEALHESEIKYRSLFESIPIGASLSIIDGSMLMMNDALQQMLGSSREKVLKYENPVMYYQNPADRKRLLEMFRAEGSLQDFEIGLKREDGKPFYASMTMIPFPAAGENAVITTTTDITERKLMQDELLFYRDHLEGVIEDRINKLQSEVTERKHIENALQQANLELEYHVTERTAELQATNKRLQDDIVKREKAEEALRKNEERYRALFESIPLGTSLSIIGGDVLMVNNAMRRMLGYTEEELRHDDSYVFYQNPSDRERIIEILKKDGSLRDFEVALRSKNGKLYHASMTIVPFPSVGEEAIITVITDITERKQVERALSESEERYRTLFENLPLGISLSVPNIGILMMNSAMEAILGYTKNELDMLSNANATYQNPADRDRLFQRLQDEGEVRDFEAAFYRKDGTPYQASLTVIPLPSMGQNVIMTVTEDITERKQAERDLRESEGRYRLLFESVALGMSLSVLGGEVLMINSTMRQMLGYSKEELMQSAPEVFYQNPEDRKRLLDRFRKEGLLQDFTVALCRKDGDLYYVSMTILPFTSLGKDVIMTMIVDITERILAREMLQQINTTLEQGIIERTAELTEINSQLEQEIVERKHIEKALLESKEQFERVVKYSPIPMAMTNLDGNIVLYNDKFTELFGYTVQDVLHVDQWWSLAYPDEKYRKLVQPTWEAALEKAVKTGTEIEIQEWNLTCKDGSVRSVEFRMTPLGEIQLMVMNDITERKQAENVLRKSEERATALLAAIPDLMFRVNSQGVFLDYKAEESDLYAQAEDTIIGKNYHDITPPEFANLAHQKIKQTLHSGEMQTFEYQLLIPDRGLINYEARMVMSGDDEVIVIVRDVTERKRLEETLRQSEERYRHFSELASDYAYSYRVDEEGQYILEWLTEESFYQITGYTTKEFDQILSIYHPDDLPLFEQDMRDLLTGQRIEREYRLIAKSGEERWVFISRHPVWDDDKNRVVHFYGVVKDITERKQLEQQRLELVLEKERMQILANFITQAAHEFRTPLAIINTSTYLLRKADNPDGRERHARKIEDQVNDIANLVDALIIMSKLDTIQELSVVSFDLNSIVKIVYDTRQSDIEDVKHNVVLELSAKPLLMQGDYDYLLMAVENILDNAICYTSAGGTITVLTGHVDGNAVIEITDTGAGISDEQLSHIFERFYRADVVGTTRGLGLGLPIARSIVERHNGKIEVESEVGKGSTFRVLLPLE